MPNISIDESAVATRSVEPVAYRINDACKALGVSRSTLYRLIANGLPAKKAGSITLIPAEAADAWLNSLPSKAA